VGVLRKGNLTLASEMRNELLKIGGLGLLEKFPAVGDEAERV